MPRIFRRLLSGAIICVYWSSFASASQPEAPQKAADAPVPESGVDRAHFDDAVRPQDDLFRAVNGQWLAKTEIPADRSDYGIFAILAEQAENDLREIIEGCSAAKDNPAGSQRQKIGDLFASFMDEDRAERLGMEPIAPQLAAVDAVRSKTDLVRTMAELNKLGVATPLGAHVRPDARKSDRHILALSQGGLGLPDRDYYWDEKYRAKRAAYRTFVARMLVLAKIDGGEETVEKIIDLETQLARIQWSKVENRNIDKTYNKMTVDELIRLAPGFDWKLYLDALGAKEVRELVVAQPAYVKALAGKLDAIPLPAWKNWLKLNVVRGAASMLSKEFVEADFAFYGTAIRGVPENRPRWKRGVAVVEGCLGEAVGKLYVERRFPPEAKERMDAMVKNVLAAYRLSIERLDWMSPATKRKALAKLATFTPKIGYPRKWRDYSALEIRRDDLLGNVRRHAIYEWNRDLAKLDEPVDRDEWHMTPQTVNAYYNPSQNEVVFPAAILQPPFFNLQADDAVNYGGIGAVIGHEAGHGFDDQGSKWDGAGNLNQWWTPADRAEFDKRGDALAEQYARFEPFPGFKVNGRLTLGENIGDLAGLTIACEAYRLSLDGKPAPVIDGMTGQQRFFFGWAQVWRRKHREADLKNRLVVDPHSPAEYRVNGTVRNVPAFYAAFDVREGDKLYLPPDKRVKIW